MSPVRSVMMLVEDRRGLSVRDPKGGDNREQEWRELYYDLISDRPGETPWKQNGNARPETYHDTTG